MVGQNSLAHFTTRSSGVTFFRLRLERPLRSLCPAMLPVTSESSVVSPLLMRWRMRVNGSRGRFEVRDREFSDLSGAC